MLLCFIKCFKTTINDVKLFRVKQRFFMNGSTLIPITKAARERIKEFAKKSETYDIAINRLLDFYDRLDNDACRECMGKYCKNANGG